MAHIKANNLVVEFPIYQNSERSMRKTIIQAATGGRLEGNNRRVVIRAIDGINFTIRDGDRIGLVGHNGSGKSTLLRVLSDIYEPAGGVLDIDGSVSSLLDIGMGFDPEATGKENIILRAITMGVSPKRIRPKIDEIMEFSGLGDYLHLPVRTYSSGMMLRLAFSVSTAIGADILLMDEWLSVGDEDFQKKASQRMHDLINQSSIVVLASHDHHLLHRVCNRIFHLEHGKIVREDTITEQENQEYEIQ